MAFIVTGRGRLTQVDSSQPEGTHFVSSSGEIDPPELQSQGGAVCAGYRGENRCDQGPMARGVCCRDDGTREYTDNDWCAYGGGELFVGQTCDEVDCFDPIEPSTGGRSRRCTGTSGAESNARR